MTIESLHKVRAAEARLESAQAELARQRELAGLAGGRVTHDLRQAQRDVTAAKEGLELAKLLVPDGTAEQAAALRQATAAAIPELAAQIEEAGKAAAGEVDALVLVIRTVRDQVAQLQGRLATVAGRHVEVAANALQLAGREPWQSPVSSHLPVAVRSILVGEIVGLLAAQGVRVNDLGRLPPEVTGNSSELIASTAQRDATSVRELSRLLEREGHARPEAAPPPVTARPLCKPAQGAGA